MERHRLRLLQLPNYSQLLDLYGHLSRLSNSENGATANGTSSLVLTDHVTVEGQSQSRWMISLNTGQRERWENSGVIGLMQLPRPRALLTV